MSRGTSAGGNPPEESHRPNEAAGGGLPDPAILSISIELADHALRGLSMSRGDYAALLCEIYEGVAMGLPYKELMEFARNSAVAAGSRQSDVLSPGRIQATGDRKAD